MCLSEDYDTGRLMDGVVYRENGTNLDSPSLTVPDAAEATFIAAR